MDPRLHRLRCHLSQGAGERRSAGRRAYRRSKELEERGFHAQVKVTRETTLLFRNVDGRREPIQRKNGNFVRR